MTSLLLLRIIYVLANFLYFIRDLTSYVFFALSLLGGKFGFYQYIQQYDVRLRYRVNLILPQI